MGDLLKGGLLWLLGVPLILVIVLFATGISEAIHRDFLEERSDARP